MIMIVKLIDQDKLQNVRCETIPGLEIAEYRKLRAGEEVKVSIETSQYLIEKKFAFLIGESTDKEGGI